MSHTLSVDHRDSSVVYSGHWIELPDSESHSTSEQYATATFSFYGSAISITGSLVKAQVDVPRSLKYILDSKEDHTFSFNASNTTVLYSSSTLLRGHHTLSISLLTDATLSINGMTIYSHGDGVGTPAMRVDNKQPMPIIWGIIGSIVLVVILFGSYILYVWRRKRCRGAFTTHQIPSFGNRRYFVPVSNTMGPLRVIMPTTKEAFTSPNSSTYGLMFIPYSPDPNCKLKPLPPIYNIVPGRTFFDYFSRV
ncbi:hypothetical protein AMATHDRAFT_2766 [Amanita thiersii Skay4041]|uniref:Uncharacterized protein n=1 Tax=Amanita thiersii Skay4041 TaxID=703135 RepID=A0A2A9NVV5_9AGAR|nr:hypothetical protein AMATHDRAFT_2766 [Amanita thiersii Skay4041]